MNDKEKRIRPRTEKNKERTTKFSRLTPVVPRKRGVLFTEEAEMGDAPTKTRIDPEKFDPILETGATHIEVPLSGERIHALKTYAGLLKEWNEKMNLTGIIDDSGIALKHFVDSLTLVPQLRKEIESTKADSLSLIDVGTGAGFPGIPLKVVMPSLRLTLLDAQKKRILFLKTVCTQLGLSDVETIHFRAEDAGRSKQYREKFDAATARAVAPLNILCEYCLPLVRVGGIFLSMKGNIGDEVLEAEKAIISMGGTVESQLHFTLPGTEMNRTIVVIRKIRPTPAKYPRAAGKPVKEPIA